MSLAGKPIGFSLNQTRFVLTSSNQNIDAAIEPKFEAAQIDLSQYHPEVFDRTNHPLFRFHELGQSPVEIKENASPLDDDRILCAGADSRSSACSKQEILDTIKHLSELHETGALTDEKFQAVRAVLSKALGAREDDIYSSSEPIYGGTVIIQVGGSTTGKSEICDEMEKLGPYGYPPMFVARSYTTVRNVRTREIIRPNTNHFSPLSREAFESTKNAGQLLWAYSKRNTSYAYSSLVLEPRERCMIVAGMVSPSAAKRLLFEEYLLVGATRALITVDDIQEVSRRVSIRCNDTNQDGLKLNKEILEDLLRFKEESIKRQYECVFDNSNSSKSGLLPIDSLFYQGIQLPTTEPYLPRIIASRLFEFSRRFWYEGSVKTEINKTTSPEELKQICLPGRYRDVRNKVHESYVDNLVYFLLNKDKSCIADTVAPQFVHLGPCNIKLLSNLLTNTKVDLVKTDYGTELYLSLNRGVNELLGLSLEGSQLSEAIRGIESLLWNYIAFTLSSSTKEIPRITRYDTSSDNKGYNNRRINGISKPYLPGRVIMRYGLTDFLEDVDGKPLPYQLSIILPNLWSL